MTAETNRRKGCGCCSGAVGGGCGCLVVMTALLIGSVFFTSHWIRTHIQSDPARITAIAAEIAGEPIPAEYTPRFGFDSDPLRITVFYVQEAPTVRAMAALMDTPAAGVVNYDLKTLFEQYYSLLAHTNSPEIIVRVVEPDGSVLGQPVVAPLPAPPEPAAIEPIGRPRVVSMYQMILPRGERIILAYYFLGGDTELTSEGRTFFRMVAE